MKKDTRLKDSTVMEDILREVSDVGRHIRSMHFHAVRPSRHHTFTYAFDPSDRKDRDACHRKITLNKVIHELLIECSVNIKTRGYTYIRDAICLITDHDTFDVCLSTDIYPHIAKKHDIRGISRIEHNIRNAIDAAYRSSRQKPEGSASLMDSFGSRPTPKEFLLHLTHEADRRLWNEISGC